MVFAEAYSKGALKRVLLKIKELC